MSNNNFNTAAIEAAAANNQVTNNNAIIMNNSIDFSSVLGEGAVAHTAAVDQQVVKDLFHAFIEIPQEVVVKFKNEGGFLKMVVKTNHREKFFRTYETYADTKLVEFMLGAMRGTMVGALETYNVDEHTLEVTEDDPRIELFRQFVNSPLRCRLDSDFIAGNGDRYMSVTFTIAYRKQVKFCLKRTEELEAIFKEAMQAA